MSVLQFGLTPKTRPLNPKRSALIAALDVGTSKIACLIARLKPQPPQHVLRRRSHAVEVIGFGHTLARGVKGGAVVDLTTVEDALRQAIDLAERSAKLQLEQVIVSMSAGRPGSELMSASVDVAGSTVGEGDIARVLAAGSRHSARDGRAVLHSLPIGYSIDGTNSIRDPRGMLARSFGIDMHVMTVEMSAVRNLMYAIESCHLDVAAMVASPYAAALSALADDEADLGAAVIDMGAGTTTIAVFSGGRFMHGDGFALGGHHVTMDIARGLSAAHRRCRTDQDAVRQRALRQRRRARHDHGRPGRSTAPRGAAIRLARPARAHRQAAGRGDPRNGARPARRFAVRGRAARARGADRRRLPAQRASSSWRRRYSAGRCASAGRSASPACRRKPRVRPLRSRPGLWSIRSRRISNTSNRGQRGT